MTHDELDEHVRQAVKVLGLRGIHIPDSRRIELPGFPDWLIIGRRVLWRENKSTDGRCTRAQLEIGRLLRRAGQDWDVWRPRDWPGRIYGELKAIT